MNKASIIFEISCIIALLALAAGLSTIAIDSSGLVVVAGLLSVFFIVSYHRLLLRVLAPVQEKTILAPSISKTRS